MKKIVNQISQNFSQASSNNIIGWKEWVSLPHWEVFKMKVKVDSGAKTSALHAHDIIYFEIHGIKMVKFKIYPEQNNHNKYTIVESKLIENRFVKSSIGQGTLRPVVVTPIQIGFEVWPIEITLVNRDLMGVRMLIGREAIKNKFLIDPSQSFILSNKYKSKSIS
jgi:hypothetical protein